MPDKFNEENKSCLLSVTTDLTKIQICQNDVFMQESHSRRKAYDFTGLIYHSKRIYAVLAVYKRGLT